MSEVTEVELRNDQRILLRHGAIMLLLGLVSGFTTLFAAVPAIALSAHNIGTIQGAVLLGLSGAWPALRVSKRIRTTIIVTALIGTYANWIGSQLAAFWGAKRMLVVSGADIPDGAQGWQEVVVAVLLNLSILVMVTAVLVISGTRRTATSDAD